MSKAPRSIAVIARIGNHGSPNNALKVHHPPPMTDDQIHKEVLKVMGWRAIDDALRGIPPNEPDNYKWTSVPPLTLDFMWQAVESMTNHEQHEMNEILYCEVVPPNERVWHATAIQMSKAFLKAKGVAL